MDLKFLSSIDTKNVHATCTLTGKTVCAGLTVFNENCMLFPSSGSYYKCIGIAESTEMGGNIQDLFIVGSNRLNDWYWGGDVGVFGGCNCNPTGGYGGHAYIIGGCVQLCDNYDICGGSAVVRGGGIYISGNTSGTGYGGNAIICGGQACAYGTAASTGGSVYICSGSGSDLNGCIAMFHSTSRRITTTTTGTCFDGTITCLKGNLSFDSAADKCIIVAPNSGGSDAADLYIYGQDITTATNGVIAGSINICAGVGTGTGSARGCGGQIIIKGGKGTGPFGSGGIVHICSGDGDSDSSEFGGALSLRAGSGATQGAVSLYHGGPTLRLCTTTVGVCVFGCARVTGNVSGDTVYANANMCTNNGFIDANSYVNAGSYVCSGTYIHANTCLSATTCVVATTRFYGACVCTTACIMAATCICATTLLCAGTCGVSVDWIATSDARLKRDIEPITNALSIVTQLQGVSYRLCDDEKCELNIGLIAQDVMEVLPEIVSHSVPNEEDVKYGITDDKLGLKYDKLTAILIEAVKEQQQQINKLELEVCDLKGNLSLIRNR
jgi:hypothetical protein